MSNNLIDFFDAYAKAMQSFDACALTDLYALPCLFAFTGGQTSYTEHEPLLANMKNVVDFYKEQGLESCRHQAIAVELIGDGFATATTTWQLEWANGKSSQNKTFFQLAISEYHASGWQAIAVTALT